MRTSAAAEELTSSLRRAVSGLAAENGELRSRQSAMEERMEALATAFAASVSHSGGDGGGGDDHSRSTAAAASDETKAVGGASSDGRAEVGCQTAGAGSGGGGGGGGGESATLAAEWKAQMSAMSDWFKAGAVLMNGAPPSASMTAVPAAVRAPTAVPAPAAVVERGQHAVSISDGESGQAVGRASRLEEEGGSHGENVRGDEEPAVEEASSWS